MASSTVPAVKQALVDLLAARAALAKVQVSYGAPASPGRELIWVGDAAGDQTFAALGVNHRDEEYTIQVVFSVLREGQDIRAADDRCFDLAAELESLLRANSTLSVSNVLWTEIGEFTLEEYASDTARESRLTVNVAVRARI